MQKNSTVVKPDAAGVITINVGDNVTIETMEGVKKIVIAGALDGTTNTTINVLEYGDVIVPPEYVNEAEPKVYEQSEAGTALIWNFVNANSVTLPKQNWLGHVIAPDASVAQMGGNYNGCIIADTLYTKAEGHVYPYTADTISWEKVFSFSKIWDDGNDADNLRPDYITVQLLANGQPCGDPVRVTAADGWAWEFTNLPLNENGEEIEYTITEDVTEDYISTVIGYDVYNTYDRTSFRLTKIWDGTEGGGIILTLYADGKRLESQPPYEQYGQMYIWEDLPMHNEDGEEIVYSATEKYMDGMTITNVRVPATGDSMPLALWTGLLVISGAALLVLMRRRRV